MGFIKNSLISFLNKRHYYLIKTYAYYRKDIWGFLKMKRLYKYKRVIYNILRYRKKYYGMMLYRVYFGIKFFNKKYTYRLNLFLTKKRLKLFYGFLKDRYFGKLGTLVKKKNGILINYFYSLLERRIDVIMFRACYTLYIRYSHRYIFRNQVLINNVLVKLPGNLLYIGDFLRFRFRSFTNNIFFKYNYSNALDTFKYRNKLFYDIKSVFIYWRFFFDFSKKLLPLFFKLSFNFRSWKNQKKISLRFLYKFPLFIYCYMYFLLYKTTRFLRFKKKHLNKKIKTPFFLFFRKIYLYLITYFSFFFFKLRKFFSKKFKKIKQVLRMYGLINLKIRFKKLFFYLRPLYFNRVFTGISKKRRSKIKISKFYRYWKFNFNIYLMLKQTSYFFFFFKGYLSHFEINYKIFMLLLIYEPTVDSITYSFGVNKWVFFDYFRRKAYF